MGFLGFGGRKESYLVVVTYEGPGRLRLNGNHVRGGSRSKQNAGSHGQTVCWAEFAPGRVRQDGGLGSQAPRLGAGEAERLLRDLPQLVECRTVLDAMEQGREHASKALAWASPQGAAPGTVGRGG